MYTTATSPRAQPESSITTYIVGRELACFVLYISATTHVTDLGF